MGAAKSCASGGKCHVSMLPAEVHLEIIRLHLLDTWDLPHPSLTPEFLQNRLPMANAWDARRPTETNIYVERRRGCDFVRGRPLRAVNSYLRVTVDEVIRQLAGESQKPTGARKETLGKTGQEGNTTNRGTQQMPRCHVLDVMVVRDIGLFPTWLTRPPDRDLQHDAVDVKVNIRVVRADVQLFPQQWVAAGQHPSIESDVDGEKHFYWSMILIMFFFAKGRFYWAAPGVVEARAVGWLMEKIKTIEMKLEKNNKELKEAYHELENAKKRPEAKGEKKELEKQTKALKERSMALEWDEEELEGKRAELQRLQSLQGLQGLQRLQGPQELLEKKEDLNDRKEGGEMGKKKEDEPEEEKEDVVTASPETSPSPLVERFYAVLQPQTLYNIHDITIFFLPEEYKCTASGELVPTQDADYAVPVSRDDVDDDDDDDDDDDNDAPAVPTPFGRSILAAPHPTEPWDFNLPRRVPRNQTPSAHLYTGVAGAVLGLRYCLSEKNMHSPYMNAVIFGCARTVTATWGRRRDREFSRRISGAMMTFKATRNVAGKEEENWPI